MSRKRVNIIELSELEKSNLKDGWQYGKSYAFRNRCQAILLSNEDYNSEELVKVFSVSQNTIYTWIKKWKNQGITGLITKLGQGRKPTLSIDNEEHVKVIESAVKNAAENGVNMKEEIIEKLVPIAIGIVSQIEKETVIVLDRAPWHTSEKTLSMISEWEDKGLFIVFLPAYSPHYNLIETLWRKIKHEWLNIKDYLPIAIAGL